MYKMNLIVSRARKKEARVLRVGISLRDLDGAKSQLSSNCNLYDVMLLLKTCTTLHDFVESKANLAVIIFPGDDSMTRS